MAFIINIFRWYNEAPNQLSKSFVQSHNSFKLCYITGNMANSDPNISMLKVNLNDMIWNAILVDRHLPYIPLVYPACMILNQHKC